MTKWQGRDCRVKAIFETSYASALQAGDTFSATVIPRGFSTEDYDEALFCISEGCVVVLTCEDEASCEILQTKDRDLSSFFYYLNVECAERIRYAVGAEAAGLSNALLLGNRSYLSDLDGLHFRRAGVTHLLALSGLHVSILAGFLEWILRRCKLPKAARAVVLCAFLLGYLGLTGCSMSACRAVLMVCILYLGFLLQTRYDALTALCTVLLLMLTVMPYSLLDISMWMSFLAAGSIVIFMPLMMGLAENWEERESIPLRLKKLLTSLLSAVFVALAANLALILLISFVYGEVSLGAIPATLVLSIPTSAVLLCTLLLLILPWATPVAWLCSWTVSLMTRVTAFFSDIPDILLPVGDPYTKSVLLVLTVAMILLAVLSVKRRLWFALPPFLAALAVGVSFGVTHLPDQGIRMTCMRETGGYLCLFSEHGEGVAVDFSDGNASDVYALKMAAGQERCTELRDLILGRYYNSQPYFLYEIATRVRVQNLHLPIPQSDSDRAMAKRLEEDAARYGIRVFYGVDGLRDSIKLESFATADAEGTAVKATLMSVKVGESRAVLMNMSVMASPLCTLAEPLCQAADYVIISSAGRTKANQAELPSTLHGVDVLILEDEELVELLPDGIATAPVILPTDEAVFYLK